MNALAGRRHDAALDQQAAIRVGQRQGIAAPPVSGAEPALEVDAPQIVRRQHRPKRLARRHRSAPPSTRCAQSLAAQQIADRRRRRPARRWVLTPQHDEQLLWPPMRPRTPQIHDRLDNRLRHRLRPAMRRPRMRCQASEAFRPVSGHQPVTGVATDPEARAQRRHRLVSRQIRRDEPQLLVRHAGFFPRHRQSLLCR